MYSQLNYDMNKCADIVNSNVKSMNSDQLIVFKAIEKAKNGKNENSTLAPPFETGQRKKRLPPPAEERTPPETEGGTLDWPLGSGAN